MRNKRDKKNVVCFRSFSKLENAVIYERISMQKSILLDQYNLTSKMRK